jgi:hypothetical protein
MSTLTFNSHSIGASAPSAGLWRRAADLYWTGWTQYAASMNNDVSLRPAFPAWSRSAADGVKAEALTPERGAATPASQRLVDRAA